jgi:uncharacterized protein
MKTNPLIARCLNFSLLLALALPAACVTVTVNFPESAVQNATDDYVKDLYRAKQKGKPSPAPAAEKSENFQWEGILSSTAWAESKISFSLDSEKANQIKEKLLAHVDDVIAQKRAGVLGETNDGLLFIKSPEKIKKDQSATINSWVKDENKARLELYDEVLETNHIHKSRLKDIKKSFARSFQSESPSGTWVQDNEGTWSQKP